ncbi:adenylate/guanylate cyclase domain-containing protein [Pigmentibacter ruber]
MFSIRNRFLFLMCGLTALVSTVCLTFGAWLLFLQLKNSSFKILNSAKETLNTSLDFQFLKLDGDSRIIANFSQFIKEIESRQSLAVLKIAKKFQEELELSDVHSYDNDGNPISLGESGNQTFINFFSENKNKILFDSFKQALDGKNSSKFMSSNNLKIIHLSPVISENKKVCGILSTTFNLDRKYLQKIAKITGVDISFFSESQMLSSSIEDENEIEIIKKEFGHLKNEKNKENDKTWTSKNGYYHAFKFKPNLVNENVTAFLSISNKENEYVFNTSKIFILILGLGIFLLSVILSSFGAAGITKGLKKLEKNATTLSAGNLDVPIVSYGTDEVSKLAKSFEIMRNSIKNLIQNLKETNLSYQRFVPKEFIDILNKDDIRKILLGDFLEQEMTILFSDIRGYTKLSESLTPKENFEFINDYLKLVAPIIKEHGGFIDKYIGDGLMALFPNEAFQAFKASQKILTAIKQQNSENQYSIFGEVNIGIGLNTGKVVIGIVGEEKRLNATVIGDAVNTASRIESMTKEVKTELLISESTFKSFDAEEKQLVEFAGEFSVKGKDEKLKLYKLAN